MTTWALAKCRGANKSENYGPGLNTCECLPPRRMSAAHSPGPFFLQQRILALYKSKAYHWFMNKTSRIKTLAGMMDRATTAALPNPLDAPDVVAEAMQVRTPASSISGAQSQSSRLPARPAWKNIFSSLRNHDFLFLWLGMVIMMGGM